MSKVKAGAVAGLNGARVAGEATSGLTWQTTCPGRRDREGALRDDEAVASGDPFFLADSAAAARRGSSAAAAPQHYGAAVPMLRTAFIPKGSASDLALQFAWRHGVPMAGAGLGLA